ncbi:MAG TPA: signal peptidase I [Ktedonosporobacter sp.]|nr:signal peptidase I [Ktedonosporobacter sp.]
MGQVAHFVRRHAWIRSASETTLLILLMTLVIHVALQNFHIQGQSMEPTLHNQEYILVDKASYLLRPPARGDIIVFQYPLNPQQDYIKRIIAVPGDIISVEDQTITVNGVRLQEPYINQDNLYNPYPPFNKHIVGPEEYFVMGDNRGDSSDSRQWGLVPRENIIGRAAFVYWPIGVDNFGILPDISHVFKQIHP